MQCNIYQSISCLLYGEFSMSKYLIANSPSIPASVQTESRRGACQEGGGQGQEGVHQAGVPPEEAAEADGGHGHRH